MSTPTAVWDTPALMTSLSRAGWGDLDGPRMAGVRRVLQAIVDLTDHRSGEGTITRAQVADTAGGMSLRWTSRCLHVLHDLGLIVWVPGWLDRGRPRPGTVRICKRALSALIRAARGRLESRRSRRAAETRTRIASTLTWTTQAPKSWLRRHNPLSVRGELSSTLTPYRGMSTPTGGGHIPTATTTPEEATMTKCVHGLNKTDCTTCTSYHKPSRRTPLPPTITEQPIIHSGARQAGTRIICEVCGQPMPTCLRASLADPSRHRPQPVTVPADEALS
ncbi:hypothetical protein [Cutibacterium porci]|uniref:hypothetical protein n=1 Tax=Cutibacterium porci TaxID=2605781 RepID=UPI0018A6D276|nr:hypothetical protein [Cutibacterium porci]